jgi:hypothetical protein
MHCGSGAASRFSFQQADSKLVKELRREIKGKWLLTLSMALALRIGLSRWCRLWDCLTFDFPACCQQISTGVERLREKVTYVVHGAGIGGQRLHLVLAWQGLSRPQGS